MKKSNIIIFIISIILILQVGLSIASFLSKRELQNSKSKTLKQEIEIPWVYRNNNSLNLNERNCILPHDDNEKLISNDFKFKDNNEYFISIGKTKKIYIHFKEEKDNLIAYKYSLAKPTSPTKYLPASTYQVKRSNDLKIYIAYNFIDLRNFYIEGNKYDPINKYLKELNAINRKLYEQLRNKKINKEELEKSKKRAYAYIIINDKGQYAIKDVQIGDKFVNKDF